MHPINSPESMVRLAQALRQLSDALFILDELDVPCEIGSGLDVAVVRLSGALQQGPIERQPVHQMVKRLEREFVAGCTALRGWE